MTDLADGMTRIAEPGDRAGRDMYVGRLRLPQIGSSAPSHLRQRHVEKYGALSRLEPVHLEPRSHGGMRTGEMKHQGCIAPSRPKSCRTMWTVIRDWWRSLGRISVGWWNQSRRGADGWIAEDPKALRVGAMPAVFEGTRVDPEPWCPIQMRSCGGPGSSSSPERPVVGRAVPGCAVWQGRAHLLTGDCRQDSDASLFCLDSPWFVDPVQQFMMSVALSLFAE